MTREEIETRADELIQCMGIWGMTARDGHKVAIAMSRKLDETVMNLARGEEGIIPNILAGTGLTGALPGLPAFPFDTEGKA